jgi:hypothetical protein
VPQAKSVLNANSVVFQSVLKVESEYVQGFVKSSDKPCLLAGCGPKADIAPSAPTSIALMEEYISLFPIVWLFLTGARNRQRCLR